MNATGTRLSVNRGNLTSAFPGHEISAFTPSSPWAWPSAATRHPDGHPGLRPLSWRWAWPPIPQRRRHQSRNGGTPPGCVGGNAVKVNMMIVGLLAALLIILVPSRGGGQSCAGRAVGDVCRPSAGACDRVETCVDYPQAGRCP